MNFHARLSPKTGSWFADWNPSKRPIQLPLPKLEYDSQSEVWEWKLKTLLRHNSLLPFIEHPGPSVTSVPRNSEQQEEIAAATHCLALLGSCISEQILSDLLTLSPNNKLPEDPYLLFRDVKKHINDVQHSWKVTDRKLCDLFTERNGAYQTMSSLVFCLENARNRPNLTGYRKPIMMAVLLAKRNFPSCPHAIICKYIAKATDARVDPGERDWVEMAGELMRAFEGA